jgi:hypothetical protein
MVGQIPALKVRGPSTEPGQSAETPRTAGRTVPVSVDRAAGDLWRWAGHDLTPRAASSLDPGTSLLLLEGGHEVGRLF